ncbi:uncharacterized protein DDB_G0287625-like [Argonauta hians]
MLELKFKDVILETIDHLRKRKARPDLGHIGNMMQRKHGISFEDTVATLDKLVESEVVYKVDYKGSTSYRNAAKWRTNHASGQIHNANQSNQKIRALGQQPINNLTSIPSGNSTRKNNSATTSNVTAFDPTSSDSCAGKANHLYSANKTGNRETTEVNLNITSVTSPLYSTSTLSTRYAGRNLKKELASLKTANTSVKRNLNNWQSKENMLDETLNDTKETNECEWNNKSLIKIHSSDNAIKRESDGYNNSNNTNKHNNSIVQHTSDAFPATQTIKKNRNKSLVTPRTLNNFSCDSYNKSQSINFNGNNENGISSSNAVSGEECSGGGGDINTSCNKFDKAIGTSHCPSGAELVHDDLLTASLSSSCVTVTTAGGTVTLKSSPGIGSGQGRRKNRLQSTSPNKPPIPRQNSKEKLEQNKLSLHASYDNSRNKMTKIATQIAPVLARRGRPVSKRKRIRKTHGPEFESEDILKFDQEKCVTCLLTADRNKHGQPEELLVCKDCNTTVHPSCMDYSEELATKARNSPWQCMECKTCIVCDSSGDGDCMLFCDACDKGYHMKCHVPAVNEKPKGKWLCNQCTSESKNCQVQPMECETTSEVSSMPTTNGNHRNHVETTNLGGLPTPQDSPVRPEAEEKLGLKEESVSLPMLRDFQGPYPDAANWSIDDVVNFFKSAGFVTQAEAFREQEIDGKSLLLMKRSDVLTGLSLKLGPALKMYTHVQNLQLVGQSTYVNGTGH